MREKMESFIENYSGAFFIGSLVKKKVIYVNKKAKSLFGVTAEDCCFEEILGVSDDRVKMMMETILSIGKNSMIYNYLVKKFDGEEIVVDIQVGFFDEECTEVFMEIIPQNDTRMQMALHQVDNSHFAEAIINLDAGLSIIHCNQAFHDVFDSNDELRHSHFHNEFINGILPSVRDSIIKDIHSTLAVKKNFSARVKVVSVSGCERWYLLELERRSLDGSGENKAIAFMTDIENQVKLEEAAVINTNFFNAVEHLTDGVLYRIDVETMTLNFLTSGNETNNFFGGIGSEIRDYVNTFVEKEIVHPDDVASFREHSSSLIEGKNDECIVRFSVSDSKYEWFNIKGYRVFDRNGKLIQVIGGFVNCEDRVKILVENTRFNQYFNVFQELFNVFLYIVEMPSKTLFHYTPNAFSNKFGTVVPNHVEELINAKIIHPEDVANYRKQIAEFITDDGQINRTPIRVAVFDMVYKWYTFTGKKIFDEKGNIKEIFGALVNVDNEVLVQKKSNQLNRYFEALQQISGESFFILDVENMVFTHIGKVAEELEVFEPIQNFPDAIYPDIHLEDLQAFKNFTMNSLNGKSSYLQVRVKMPNCEYQWYELFSQVIYNDLGEITEVVGKMNNIHSSKVMQSEVTCLNSHFNALQSISGESIFCINLNNRTFEQFGDVAIELGLVGVIGNYPDSILHVVHTDDIGIYKQFSDTLLKGRQAKIQFRAKKSSTSEYIWYEKEGVPVRNLNGVEIIGKMNNIQAQKTYFEKATTLNSYFEALQSVSGESFFVIDVKTKILNITGKIREELNITEPVVNFPDSIIDKIHPDDKLKFVQYNSNSLNGIPSSIEMQIINTKGEYQWFGLNSKAMFDENGVVVEVVGNIKNIHSVKNMSVQNISLNKYLTALQEFSKDVFFRVDVPTMTLHHSHSSERMKKIGSVIPDYIETIIAKKIVHPDDANIYRKAALEWFENESLEYEVRFSINDDYTYEWFCIKAKKIYDDDGNFVEALGTMINTQKEHNIHSDYDQINQYFRAMQDLSDDIIFHIDIPTKTFNHTHENQNGLNFSNSIPNFVETFVLSGYIHPEHVEAYRDYTEKLFMGLNHEFKVQALVGEGVYNWFEIKCKYVYNDMNHPVEIFGKMCNIQEKLDLERKAKYDMLTNALSREAFEERVSHDLAENGNICNALIFIDLDNFKYINDNFGHKYGDFVLQKFTKRVNNCIKSTDFIGRVGGDEFVVYLRDVGSPEIALGRANQIIGTMTRPISNGQVAHKLGLSIGIAISPNHGIDLLTLYDNADKAVYISKDRGKNTATLFNETEL